MGYNPQDSKESDTTKWLNLHQKDFLKNVDSSFITFWLMFFFMGKCFYFIESINDLFFI